MENMHYSLMYHDPVLCRSQMPFLLPNKLPLTSENTALQIAQVFFKNNLLCFWWLHLLADRRHPCWT